jgi:aminopeptidase YwaD
MKIKTILSLTILLLIISSLAMAQINPWKIWTFLSEKEMAEIIGETSGETALNTIMATGGYNRNRQAAEYQGTFYEAEFVLNKLKQYGLKDARIDRFPASASGWGGGKQWDGIKGELWEVSPTRQKLASYRDMTAMLATGSNNADLEAELVWVGKGTKKELAGLKLEGKIVVTDGRLYTVHNEACIKLKAAGVIVINTQREHFDPNQIPWMGIFSRDKKVQPKFAFYMTAREGAFLKRRLLRGEKIKVHAQVEVARHDYTLQIPTCIIPGTDENAQELIFSAHIFEGYAKQGANDNKSGTAAILEIARVLNTLIKEGRIAPPKRTIRFIWIPEFSGTIPWVKANKEIMARTLCNINYDMVGEWLSKNKGVNNLCRTTYANPHYINDVLENYFRFIGEGSLEKNANKRILKRIVAPTGSDEPFLYTIEEHSGASDHEVFNDWGVQVPGVKVIVWPDQWYHTSGDRPDKSDPTQLKRIAIVGAAAAYTIASADDAMAIKIAGETTSNATRRIGRKLNEAIVELDAADAKTFQAKRNRAEQLIKYIVINEIETLDSIMELAKDKVKVGSYIRTMKRSINDLGKVHSNMVANHSAATAARLKIEDKAAPLSALEQQAQALVYKTTPLVLSGGYGGYNDAIKKLPKETKDKYKYDRKTLPNSRELARLINGKRDALTLFQMSEIQSMRPGKLDAALNYLKILEAAGLIEEVK